MDLKSLKVVVSTHVYTTGPAQDLEEFLLTNNVNTLLFIGHPLMYDPKLKGSFYELYQDAKLVKSYISKHHKFPLLFSYFIHGIKSLLIVSQQQTKWDLYIGSNCLNAFIGVILKFLGHTKKVVYYVIDYDPNRYSNKLLNMLYHMLDQYCVTHCDETWNLSPRMAEGRKQYYNFVGGNQHVVPVGIWFDRINRLDFENIDKNTLVFMGHVRQKQGVQNVLKAIPRIIKTMPDFKFKIIGGGDYIDTLKALTERLNITNCVEFTGFVEKHTEVEDMLTHCAVAIAPYELFSSPNNNTLSFTYYADPAKIKLYLACGLPVLLTEIPYNSKDIVESGCGKLITDDEEVLTEAVVAIMSDLEKLKTYRLNAINYARKYNWKYIFEENINRLL